MLNARLLLIDDHTLFRTGLRLVLADSPSVAGIIESGSVMGAVQDHRGAEVDIILLDIQMPGLNGIEGIRVLRRHFPTACILIVSGTSGLETIPPSARKEIAGFLPKSADSAEIEDAIASCLRGDTYFSLDPAGDTAGIPDAGGNGSGDGAAPGAAYQASSLTPRQLEVLAQLSLGRSNKIIAHHLGLSENTVRVHVAAILNHLGVVSRVEAVLEAQRRGLVQTGR
ncbi:response regulator transcription factor [Cupriavidus basilensis]|uniref:Response regulator transcription factor n=1 Tax=Cupriavidus basilensis TaxID=68895 RepID=A0ABT6AFW5_9BURK|nr:response regulator transcription factor [Cupriavidus basilensis]MDF3831354.1 response regulator transcription factor [Cupriavidus basilensis]